MPRWSRLARSTVAAGRPVHKRGPATKRAEAEVMPSSTLSGMRGEACGTARRCVRWRRRRNTRHGPVKRLAPSVEQSHWMARSLLGMCLMMVSTSAATRLGEARRIFATSALFGKMRAQRAVDRSQRHLETQVLGQRAVLTHRLEHEIGVDGVAGVADAPAASPKRTRSMPSLT